jgi:hypothetical protein
MDVAKILQELKAEKQKLDQAIAVMEAVVGDKGTQAPTAPSKRGGRKHMSELECKEVSRRMKRYWDSRRNQAVAAAR